MDLLKLIGRSVCDLLVFLLVVAVIVVVAMTLVDLGGGTWGGVGDGEHHERPTP